VKASLAAPDRNTWTGRRDHALLLTAIQTGLRVSELTGLRCQDLRLGPTSYLFTQGKNRKQRTVPLTSQTIKVPRVWLKERQGQPADPLFPTTHGGALSRDAVKWLIAKHAAVAAQRCPTLQTKKITAHALRHTTAMTLLQSDISTMVIALWLGHEQEQTTRGYLHGDPRLKQRALDHTAPPHTRPRRAPRHRQPPRVPRQPLSPTIMPSYSPALEPLEQAKRGQPTKQLGITRPRHNTGRAGNAERSGWTAGAGSSYERGSSCVPAFL
jgi:hypothetical protein